jgi:hypothetical protein
MRQQSTFSKAFDLAVTSLTAALMLPARHRTVAKTKTTATKKTTEL